MKDIYFLLFIVLVRAKYQALLFEIERKYLASIMIIRTGKQGFMIHHKNSYTRAKEDNIE